MTDAERKARKKYRDKGSRLTVDFYPSELELYRWVEQQSKKQTYIKNLIRADMAKSTIETDRG